MEELNSGPGGMAVYENPGDPNNKRWLFVTDGACHGQQQRRRLFERCGRRQHARLQLARGSVRRRETHGMRMASCATQTPAVPLGAIRQDSGVTNYVSTLNPLLNTANCTNPGPQYLTSAGVPTNDRLLSAEPPGQRQAVRPQDPNLCGGIPHRWWMYGSRLSRMQWGPACSRLRWLPVPLRSVCMRRHRRPRRMATA